jgi:uncharacterized membrane protein
MTSHKFKQELKQEAEQWHLEGLIDRDIYDTLAQRYQFTNLATNSNHGFIAVVITFGCILLGLGVITFVAANWQVWSKPIKVAILLGFFIITNITGFSIWQKATENWQSLLGQGLLLVGSLILGANIGLMSQMFHQTGEAYQLYLIWGSSVLLMAYGLQLASLGIVAFILIAISYFSTFTLFAWEDVTHIIQLTPILISLLFIPLAYLCRSAWLFFLVSYLVIISFAITCFYNIDFAPISLRGLLFAIAFAIPLAFFWSYQDQPKLLNVTTSISFSALSRKIIVFNLSTLLYLASFHWFWDYSELNKTASLNNWFNPLVIGNILFFGLISIYWWWKLGQRPVNSNIWRLERHSIYIAIAIIISSILTYWHLSIVPIGYLGTIFFNLMLFALGLILIRQALKSEKRLGYWSGILLLSLQVLSRMFEYNTGLLTKALVLFICGIAVIMAGIWFEKYLSRSL